MNEQEFVKFCKKQIVNYTNDHLDKTDNKVITEDDVFIVWLCKTLQNNKALLSTTLFDGMYYEITYNGFTTKRSIGTPAPARTATKSWMSRPTRGMMA